jgi:hypothetical protein
MEACVGAHHLSRRLKLLGHDARLMPAKYVRPYSKGQKNDLRDAEAIAEAVQRPTMKFVAISARPCRNGAMRNGRCRMHGGKATGAPKGNRNAFKHGNYSFSGRALRQLVRFFV